MCSQACAGGTAAGCSYTCELGFLPTRAHICHADGAFRGGACAVARCPSSRLPNSRTACTGEYGAACAYGCRAGLVPDGVRMHSTGCGITCFAALRRRRVGGEVALPIHGPG